MVIRWLVVLLVIASGSSASPVPDGADGPLGEWPDFRPIGYITAPHPDDPSQQTHLYGDWGAIVGEEFLFIQDGQLKLLYHSYHETYLTQRPLASDILPDWALGYDPVTKIKLTPLALPGGPVPGPAWQHTDTPGYLHHPVTGEHLIYNTTRPGTTHLHPEWEGLPGYESSIQVAVSDDPPTQGVPFWQNYLDVLQAELWWEQGWNQNGVIKGGLSEPTPVWVPHLGDNGMVRLFYRGLHGAPGSFWNWRISYADSPDGKRFWTKHETPVFDPSDPGNPAHRWTQPPPEGYSFRGSWQAHCTGDVRADGVHMVMCVSNQNYAGGGALAYYWSPDWGDTWFGHPDNPILVPGQHALGVPATGFQRTPTLAVDEEFGRYILAYNAGYDANQPARRATHLALASRPEATPTRVTGDGDVQLRLVSVTPNPGPGVTRLAFDLPTAGRLRVCIYGLDGRRVADLGAETRAAGRQAITWNRRSDDGSKVASGVYLFRAELSAGRAGIGTVTGRFLVIN